MTISRMPTLERIYIAYCRQDEALDNAIEACGIGQGNLVYATRRYIVDADLSYLETHATQTCISVLELQISCSIPTTREHRMTRLRQLLPLARKWGAVIYYPDAEALLPIAHVISDLDGTLLRDELLVSLAKQMGIGAKFEEITQRAMSGDVDFAESFRQRTLMLAGTKYSQLVSTAISARPTLGFEGFLQWLRVKGLAFDLVTSNYDIFCEALRECLGFDNYYASSPLFESDELTGYFEGNIIDAEAKADVAQRIVNKRGITLAQTLILGDGANDLPMLSRAGHAVLYRADSANPLPLTIVIELIQLNG
ncbi:MAG: HAD-IB family phosphatase [Porphyromonadaceae bacterium]|nr:HAD-IB family phosphatase [Porphyromonadaceae bacterium]